MSLATQFLRFTSVVDADDPGVRDLAAELRRGRVSRQEIARACFEWVRDEVRHTVDYRLDPVTCSASEVLRERTGFCFAKSHLVAALLRASGIPAGFVYQRLALDDLGKTFCLHGLNAVWLPHVGWYRIDARGNRADLRADFDPPREVLPYPVAGRGERLFPQVWAEPLPLVIEALRRHRTRAELEANLPDAIDNDLPLAQGDVALRGYDAAADAISPSYFVAIAAVQLGFFQQEGIDMEFVFSPPNPSQALKDGTLDFFGGSPYTGLRTFPGWRGGVLLCALSHYTYWFLAVRSDIKCERGDVSAVKGLRLSASADPGLTLKRLLEEAGIDLQRENVRIVPSPRRTSPNWAWDGVDAVEQGISDGYWGNGLRADLGVKRGVAKILLDVRRGDGPPAARHWTFPALVTTERLVKEHPDIAAAAVRAIVKTQRALRADPQLAVKAAQRLFPAEEASLIAYEVARDEPFYDATITEEMVTHISRFARDINALEGEVKYDELVATRFAGLWKG